MKPTAIVKIIIDCGMTILFTLLMAFELIGRTAHEWIGIGMFILFVAHHILNGKWINHISRQKYTSFRILQTVLAGLVLLTMLGSMISSVLISREVFVFLPVHSGRAFGRILHMICAYWGFVFMALHLGIHWNTMMRFAGRICRKPSRARRILLRVIGACIAVYGMYAFVRRGFSEYMFLRTQFVFFDFNEPLIYFFLDYLAIMGLFIWVGYFLTKTVQIQKHRL